MEFSRRTDWPAHSNKLSELHQSKIRQGVHIIDLTESNPTRCSFGYLKPACLEPLLDPKSLVYEPNPHGLAEAREAVCRYYAAKKISIHPDQVFLTAGTSEAYSFVFRLLAGAGDAILVPRPSYPLLDYLASLNDIDLARYPLIYDGGWRIDFQNFEKSVPNRCRALVVVNPNNPTGNFIRPDEKARIGRGRFDKGVAVISDEVFLDFGFDNVPYAPAFAGENGVLSFTLSGISKILGLPQMKLSWMVVGGPPGLRREAIRRLEIIADTYLSVNTPVQRALGPWLEAADSVVREITERIRENRRYLEAHFDGSQEAQVLKADGGWYAVIKAGACLPARQAPLRGDEEMAVSLLEKHNVLVYPGYLFDFADGDYWVVSLLPSPEVFREGVARLTVGSPPTQG